MKTITGLFAILFGLFFLLGGIYVGVWEWLIGGICDIVDAIKATPTDKGMLAWGLLKAIFCEIPIFIGISCAYLFWGSLND